MKQVKIIKKKDDYTMEYEVGDICKVTGTWYGGVHIEGKTGIPVSIDRDEQMNQMRKMFRKETLKLAISFVILSGSGYLRRVQSICIRCLLLHSIRRMERSW